METTPVDPEGEALELMLTLPAGFRVRVEATSTDPGAVRWLQDLAVAAMVLAVRCEEAAATRSAR